MGSNSNKRPNVVLFVHDSWRWDVMGHMGNPAAQTPVHDHLVETDAVSFSSAFCQNPVCVPSRCSFMTGWYTHVRGHRAMEYGLESGEPMLLQNMMRSGYHVWWAGRTHDIHSNNDVNDYCSEYYPLRNVDGLKPNWSISRRGRGWGIDGSEAWRGDPETSDQYYSFYVGEIDSKGEPYYFDGDWAVVEAAIERIKTYDSDQPFCLYLPLTYPHPPYAVEEPWYSAIDRAAIPDRLRPPSDWSLVPSHLKGIHDRNRMAGWTEDRWRELRAVYYAMCARVDHQLGKVVEALQEAGLYDDTALFSFSDHGDFTGDYNLLEKVQNTFQDCLTRVPLLVKPPRGITLQPRVSDALVELIDVPATVEDWCGIEPGHRHFGRSLSGLLAQEQPHRDAVFSEGGRLEGDDHCIQQGAIDEGPTGMYWPRVIGHQNIPEHTKAIMCRTRDYKYVRRLYETDELYDLRSDPHEVNNRIHDPKMSGVLAELKDRLLSHYLETSDVVPRI